MSWVHPFTSVIAGPTGSGKSIFVRRFVHNIRHMMTPITDRILWWYGEYQTLHGAVDGVDFQQGLPDLDTLDPRDKHLIILDDLMDETDQRVASLFTKKSHHRNISVMLIVQNLFNRNKYHRTISLNTHYMDYWISICLIIKTGNCLTIDVGLINQHKLFKLLGLEYFIIEWDRCENRN